MIFNVWLRRRRLFKQRIPYNDVKQQVHVTWNLKINMNYVSPYRRKILKRNVKQTINLYSLWELSLLAIAGVGDEPTPISHL